MSRRTVEDKLNSDIDFDIKKSNIKNNNVSEKEYIKKCMIENKSIEINQANPKNKDSSSYDRYERYKKANNYERNL